MISIFTTPRGPGGWRNVQFVLFFKEFFFAAVFISFAFACPIPVCQVVMPG